MAKLYQHQARCKAPLLRMWDSCSWCSWVSSSAESVRHSPLTVQMSGRLCYEKQVSFRNIHILSQASVLVSILVSLLSLPLKPLLIKTWLLNLWKNLKKSYTAKFKKEDTLGQSQAKRLKHLLAPSSVLPFQLFQSQDELANIVTFRTIRS